MYKLLEATAEDSQQHHNEPVLIMGDFNIEICNSPLALAMVAGGEWWEVGAADSPPDPPTCMQGDNKHRLDWCMLNRVACSAYRSHTYALHGNVWPHLAIVVSFSWEDVHQVIRHWKRPLALPLPEAPWPDKALKTAEESADKLTLQFLSLPITHTRVMWAAWNTAVENWWHRQALSPVRIVAEGCLLPLSLKPRTWPLRMGLAKTLTSVELLCLLRG